MDTFFTWIGEHPFITLIIVLTVILLSVADFKIEVAQVEYDKDVEDNEEEEEEVQEWPKLEHRIVCSVPGQPVISLLPGEYKKAYMYAQPWYIEVEVDDKTKLYLPKDYTTIVSSTFKSTNTEK